MNILIVSATENEVQILKTLLSDFKINNDTELYRMNGIEIDFLVTGVGIVFSIYQLLKKISRSKYNLVINMGIAGALNNDLIIGSVVNIVQEQFGDLGIETKSNFLSLFDTEFIAENDFPFKKGVLNNSDVNNLIVKLPQCKGITVNTAHGNKQSIKKFKQKFDADIETMEGAAIFYVCLLEDVKFIQIRAISNYVTERNENNWDIPKAITNLNNVVHDLLNKINGCLFLYLK
ncbi:MAG: futalosine hydrolase [Bacteroidales bacterium]|nr:futalosine hydrolase [Bacteroidales bacterium]